MINILESKYAALEDWYVDQIWNNLSKNLAAKRPELEKLKKILDEYNMDSSQIEYDEFWKALLLNPTSESSREKFPFLNQYYSFVLLLQRDSRFIKLYYDYKSTTRFYPRNTFLRDERKRILDNYLKVFMKNEKCESNWEVAQNFTNYDNLFKSVSKKLEPINKCLNELINYNILSWKNGTRVELLKQLNINVCPYCNRQFISLLKTEKNKEISLAYLDHFFPKAKFPLYSLALYNFVPSCGTCNSLLKYDSFLPIKNPISSKKNMAPFFKFYYSNLGSLLGMNTNISIKVNRSSLNNFLFENQFKLESQYEYHAKDVQLFHKRNLLYKSAYLEGYKKMFKDNPPDEKTIKEVIYGFSNDEFDLFLKPLSKMHYDLFNSDPNLLI